MTQAPQEGNKHRDLCRGCRITGAHVNPPCCAIGQSTYLAYHDALSEPTEVFHDNIRKRFDHGDRQVVSAMRHFAELAAEGREALRTGGRARLSAVHSRTIKPMVVR